MFICHCWCHQADTMGLSQHSSPWCKVYQTLTLLWRGWHPDYWPYWHLILFLCRPQALGQKSSISVDALYSELKLKGISTKWCKLGYVLKINQLEEIRKINKNDPDKCLYAVCKELVGIKGGIGKLCKALESDMRFAESLKCRYGSVIALKGE